MVISANDEFGRPILVDSKERYDLAYTKFENDLHNVLRPIVESVVKSKTRGQWWLNLPQEELYGTTKQA